MSATAEAAVPAAQTTITALKTQQPPDAQMPEISAGFTTTRAFDLLQRAGKALAASSIIPEIYRGNLPNCVIALEMAQRIGASPLMVMQNLYIVYGRPAWSGKFLIACFNQCGRFSAIRYLWSGTRGKDDWGCQAWAVERATGEKIFGPLISMELVKAEGWYGRKDSKWKTMPEKMFMYRSAAWMIDTHAPELSMGINMDDEVRDTFDARLGPDGQYSVTTESLRQAEHLIETTAAATVVDAGSAEKSGPDSEAIDGYTKSLREAGSTADLEVAWTAIRESFKGFGVPVHLEALHNDRTESLRQVAAKQQDMKL